MNRNHGQWQAVHVLEPNPTVTEIGTRVSQN
jgi:hypothetical protein